MLHDYEARIKQAVKDNLGGAEVLKFVLDEHTTRPGYWERIYNVAWRNQRESGTHRVCIDSKGNSMCVWGHFLLTPEEAIADMWDRTPVRGTK